MSGTPATILPAERRLWRRTARACVIIAASFCVVMAAMLGVLWMQQKMHHPLVETSTGTFAGMRERLQTQPADDATKAALRQEDAALRQAYWTRQAQMERGAWLLLAGAMLLVGGIKLQRTLDRRVPQREALRAPAGPEAALAQWMVAGMGGAIMVLLLAGAWWSLAHPALPASGESQAAPLAETAVTTDELLAQWPAFRGWGGAAARVPEPAVREWDGASGRGILWRAPVALPGNSSPIVWNKTVIVTGADETQRQVFAFDLQTGKPLWQTAVGGAGAAPEISEDTSFAAPTPVTDGRRVYAIFATGDLAAIDLATGRKIWEKSLGKPASVYGYAASLAIFADAGGTRVIVQWDMGTGPEENKSSLMALEGRTGRTLWQTRRPVGNSWASPLVTKVPADAAEWQVVTAANPWVIGYHAGTGEELWRTRALGGDVAPSPAAAVHGGRTMVFASQEGVRRVAIAISGPAARGETRAAWSLDDEGMPDIVSPVSDGRYLWTVIGSGVLFCFDVDTGKKAWEHEFGASFHATPSLVRTGDSQELWLTDATGLTHRIAVEAAFREIGTYALGENVNASLAFDASTPARIVVRARKTLYCLGSAAAGGTP